MSWIKAAKNREFRYEIKPNMLYVTIVPEDIENHELIAPIKEKYGRELERIKLSDVTPAQKVRDLEELRESMAEEASKVGREAGFAIALQKLEAIGQAAFDAGVETSWELKESPTGDLEWEKLIYPTALLPEDELELTEEER